MSEASTDSDSSRKWPAPRAVTTFRLRRIDPVQGLMIDVDAWRDAHDYHRDAVRLHHLALHGWGIVSGLEVTLGASDNALLIKPGVAVDPAGNVVVVDQEQVHRIEARTRGAVYLVLQLQERPGQQGQAARVVEGFAIAERDRLPDQPCIELARIDFNPTLGAVRQPRRSDAPGEHELDLRARVHIAGAAAQPPHADAGGGPTDGLGPRFESLTRQVETLAQRLDRLAQHPNVTPDPAAGRADGPPRGAEPGAAAERLEALADQLDGLAHEVDVLARRAPAPADGPQVSAGAETKALARQTDDLSGRLEALASRVDLLGERAAEPNPELAELRRQLERLALDVATLESQLRDLDDRLESARPPDWGAASAAPAVALTVAIARHGAAGWDQHRDGVRLLAREVGATTDWSAASADPTAIASAVGVDVLYLCGFSPLALDDADAQAITRLLQAGGVVMGEGCAAGPDGEAGARAFAFSFAELAQRLGLRLTRVERGHGLFQARHVFAEPPPGARPSARVLESGGMIYSDADYGCAWQGGTSERALPRTAIRDAFEFGVNVAVYRRATR